MKNPLNFIKYFFLLSLGLGITNQTFSPEIKSYASKHTLSELNEINIRRAKEEKRQFIIEELKKPVLKFDIPVDTGQISCVYGFRKANATKEFHNGIDIGIVGNASLKFAERPDVLSVAPGIVAFAGNETGYGKVVKIKHQNNLETIYAHLNNFFVEKGDSVLSRQKIGEMGQSGNARSNKKRSKIHLHFEARRNNKPFNPNKYFVGHKKIGIDDTLYSFISENNSVSYLPVENIKQSAPEVVSIGEKINLNKIQENFYEIQIAASSNRLSKRKITNLEKMYGSILKENEINGMYKYSIKQFKSLEDALGFKNSLNSKDNLGIIVYKNNKIVETKWNF